MLIRKRESERKREKGGGREIWGKREKERLAGRVDAIHIYSSIQSSVNRKGTRGIERADDHTTHTHPS